MSHLYNTININTKAQLPFSHNQNTSLSCYLHRRLCSFQMSVALCFERTQCILWYAYACTMWHTVQTLTQINTIIQVADSLFIFMKYSYFRPSPPSCVEWALNELSEDQNFNLRISTYRKHSVIL